MKTHFKIDWKPLDNQAKIMGVSSNDLILSFRKRFETEYSKIDNPKPIKREFIKTKFIELIDRIKLSNQNN